MREVGSRVCFIEVINEDPDFLLQQYAQVAETSPDYAGYDREAAVSGFFFCHIRYVTFLSAY
jgi:hypothetical protein